MMSRGWLNMRPTPVEKDGTLAVVTGYETCVSTDELLVGGTRLFTVPADPFGRSRSSRRLAATGARPWRSSLTLMKSGSVWASVGPAPTRRCSAPPRATAEQDHARRHFTQM